MACHKMAGIFIGERRYPPRRRSLLWWTLTLAATFDRRELPASTSHREHRFPPLSHVNKKLTSEAWPDCPTPHTDRPWAQPATGNGCPIARVDSYAVHFASNTESRKAALFFTAFVPSESGHGVLTVFWFIFNYKSFFQLQRKESTSDDMPSFNRFFLYLMTCLRSICHSLIGRFGRRSSVG